MKRESGCYCPLFGSMPDAFAYHQVIYDQQGSPVNYIFLEINSAFEELTGLKRSEVIGRKVTEIHPEIGESAFDWINVYGKVASKGENIRFEKYFEPADRWYDVSAFSDTPGYFAVLFREVTLQKNENLALKRLAGLTRRILQEPGGDVDFQAISDGLLELSGAKFAAVNLYSEDGRQTVTKAISGLAGSIRRASDLIGFELVGKGWNIIPARLTALKEGRLLYFASLYDAASGSIPKIIAGLLEKTFGTGAIYIAEIGSEGETIGDLIIFMPPHQLLVNPQVIELYATQVGFVLMGNRADLALRESRDQYQSLVDNLPGASYRCLNDKEWTMIYMSSDIDNITGYPSSDFIHNQVRSYASVTLGNDTNHDAIIAEAIAAGTTWDVEYRVVHSNGDIRWVHEKGRGVKDDQGRVLYLDGLILDITDRKRVEEELKASELRHRALVGAIPDLLFRYSSKGVYLDAEVRDDHLLYAKAKDLYLQKALIGKAVTDVFPEAIANMMMSSIGQALASGEIQVIEYSYPVDGKESYFEARLAPIGNAEVVSIVRDITERKSYLAELEHISLHDQLTGLYNRHYFKNELERLSFSRDYPITLISADLDGLKLVNDNLGHVEGDRYLQTGACLLKSALRASDILARVGGDEFAIILPRTDREAAEELVTRLQARIEQFNQEEQGLPISISIGLAVSSAPEIKLEETYKDADNAMYKDKYKRSQLARAAIVDSIVKLFSNEKN